MKRPNFSGRLIHIFVVLIVAVSLGMARAEEPGRYDKGTIFSFHFDEGGGKEVTDFSGNDNHGDPVDRSCIGHHCVPVYKKIPRR